MSVSTPVLLSVLLASARAATNQAVDEKFRALLLVGIPLSLWLVFSGAVAVGAVGLAIRHFVEPPSRLTRRLSWGTVGANLFLLVGSVVVAVYRPAFYSPEWADLGIAAKLIAAIQVLLSAVVVWPLVSESAQGEHAASDDTDGG